MVKDYNKAGNAGGATTPRGRQNYGGDPTLAEAMEKHSIIKCEFPKLSTQVIYRGRCLPRIPNSSRFGPKTMLSTKGVTRNRKPPPAPESAGSTAVV
jgi:hypothetical protein